MDGCFPTALGRQSTYKLKEEDIKSNQQAKHSNCWGLNRKRSQTPVSPITGNNNVTMSTKSQSRSTRHQRSTSAIVSKISRGRTTQALKHNHTKFVCNALWVWKPLQIHRGGWNLIKSLQAKNQTSSRIQHGLQLLDKSEIKTNAQEHYYSNPTDYELMHAPRVVLIQRTRPFPIDGLAEIGNNSSGKHARHAETLSFCYQALLLKSLTVELEQCDCQKEQCHPQQN